MQEHDPTYEAYPKAQRAFEQKVDELLKANPKATEDARKLLDPDKAPRVVTINPPVAAALHRHFNKLNRNFSVIKAMEYGDAMTRDEWKLNHQGMASFPDGFLGDGQHRCGAIVLSGREQQFMMFGGLAKEAVDTIDLNKGRNAGDALEIAGIADGKVKASIGKTVMEYRGECEYGRKPKLSVIQVEIWVTENDGALSEALRIGRNSTENVSEPCMGVSEAATIALLMALGGYTGMQVSGFVASIQQGMADYPEAPTTELSRKFTKAKFANNKRDRLSRKVKLAITAKAASAWVQNQSVAKLVWVPAKESLVKFAAPSELELAKAA